MVNKTVIQRCQWVGDDPLYLDYHDQEWGVPVREEQALFAKLCLDGAQAGLSWLTILRKRENYYQAFDNFDPQKIVQYDKAKIAELLANSGIVRNQLKIQSVIRNARGYLAIQEEKGSFSDFLWQFVDGQTIQNRWESMEQMPAHTAESRAMSLALKKYGFNFVGPTICYAFMQAVGMVNDHTVDCFRASELSQTL